MIIKKIVAITIITSLGLTFLLLVAGLLIPMSVLKKLEGKNNSTNQNVQNLDQNGKPIDNANIPKDPKVAGATQSASNTTASSGTSSGFKSTTTSTSTNTVTNTGTVASPTVKPTSAPTSIPTYAPTPTAIACGQPGGSCTAAQVAAHNSSGNCWAIYSGGYYIFSGSGVPSGKPTYTSGGQHPGGSSVFNSSTCGKDITSYMSGSSGGHKHSNGAYSDLASYRVGSVN